MASMPSFQTNDKFASKCVSEGKDCIRGKRNHQEQKTNDDGDDIDVSNEIQRLTIKVTPGTDKKLADKPDEDDVMCEIARRFIQKMETDVAGIKICIQPPE